MTASLIIGAGNVPAAANPSGLIGLSAVNGVAATWTRSDATHAIDVSIAPTWTGLHTFAPASGTAIAVTAKDNTAVMTFNDASVTSGYYIGLSNGGVLKGAFGLGPIIFSGAATGDFCLFSAGTLRMGGTGTGEVAITTGGVMTVAGALGVNGNAAPAKVTGWGTPTGGTVVASFAAGATPSLLQMSEAVAQIITDLKAFGIYGA